jgi:hypothetical protein
MFAIVEAVAHVHLVYFFIYLTNLSVAQAV